MNPPAWSIRCLHDRISPLISVSGIPSGYTRQANSTSSKCMHWRQILLKVECCCCRSLMCVFIYISYEKSGRNQYHPRRSSIGIGMYTRLWTASLNRGTLPGDSRHWPGIYGMSPDREYGHLKKGPQRPFFDLWLFCRNFQYVTILSWKNYCFRPYCCWLYPVFIARRTVPKYWQLIPRKESIPVWRSYWLIHFRIQCCMIKPTIGCIL